VRGATYGTFAPRSDGELFPLPSVVHRDFEQMAATGLNTVRTYTSPPPDVLAASSEFGLRLLAGIAYDDWRCETHPGRAARRRIRDSARRALGTTLDRCAGRPEILALSIGNEVPSDVIRVHGIRAVEELLSELVEEAHEADPELLVTYANFPTTEYLRIEGQDLISFNVFLERPEQLRAYLRHLQVVAGDVPLLLTEVGLAAQVHGDDEQADSLAWQLRLVDEAGCAGATVFSWTDDWAVGGQAVEGWGFGLTDVDRRPRPALDVVARWARSSLHALRPEWPTVSVVVCAHNAARTLSRCLDSLTRCEYPALEVIVCDDGSSDDTATVAQRSGVRLLELPHRGLSAARNAGIDAASGEIVAFLDADAACHPEWPYYLALSLEDDGVAATGGPNLQMADAGFTERAVAASPGGPVHVLVGDDRAEHVPGCNMAFRKEALEAIGGFDPTYRTAGDDVDVCWKVLEHGAEVAFSAAAQVRHHRRDSVRAYLRQQRGYGRAERQLAGCHRHRFNGFGQARWSGFIYGGARLLPTLLRPLVYHGSMGTAPFQPVVAPRAEMLSATAGAHLPALAMVALLGVLAPLSLWWVLAPLVAVSAMLAYGLAVAAGVRPERREPHALRFRLLVGFLHVAQPLVRAWGRLTQRSSSEPEGASAEWTGDRAAWMEELRAELGRRGCRVQTGAAHKTWDLECASGPLLKARITTAVIWWQPFHRATLRPRAFLLGIAVFAASLFPFSAWMSAAALVAITIAALREAVVLRSSIRTALETTTRGRRPGGDRRPAWSLLEELHPGRHVPLARPRVPRQEAYETFDD